MTRIIQSFDEIAGRYRAVLCDLWGCYHDGLRPYPAAVAAMRRFRTQGGLVVLLTNAPRAAASVRSFLDRIGAPPDSYDGIMSSGEACQRAVASGQFGRRFLYVGPERDRNMLTDAGLTPAALDEAEAILCTGLRDDAAETPGDYAAEIADWVARGLPMLCANPDIVVDRGTERLWCAGALARAYEEAGGRLVWFGKPHATSYDQAFELIAELAGASVPRAAVIALGDGIATDVRGALDYGLEAVFVSGGLAAAEVGDDPESPDPDRLADYFRVHGVTPHYTIGRLR